MNGAEQSSAIGVALYPIISRLEPIKAGIIASMLLELDTDTLLGYLGDPPSIKEVIDEALSIINGPPPKFGTLRHNSPGRSPDPSLIPLDEDVEMEGGHANDQRKL